MYKLFYNFELPVVLWAFIVSQVFGLINIGLAVYRYQLKKRDKVINIKIAGNFSKLLNLVFLLNFTLVGLKIVSIIKNFTMKKVTKEGSKVSRRTSILLLVLFCFVKAVIVFIFWYFVNDLWFEWVILGTALFAMIGKWQKNMHIMRLSSVVNMIAIFINSVLFFFNPTSIIKAVFVIGSILVFYVIFVVQVRRKNRSDEGAEEEGKELVAACNCEVGVTVSDEIIIDKWDSEEVIGKMEEESVEGVEEWESIGT